MKKFASFAVVGLIAFAGFGLTGCSGGGENEVLVVDETPPPTLNSVDMDNYEKEMAGQGQGNQ